ncbi:ead/Ea22-like family protein [Enterobacter hormaechei]|uniref:ead/Ea22-like family protein n=1 Tax=Enterobacter hormaechei TaxID=158836 RepID=UPI000F848DD9|nr:ead/Ea22-like family protein [Enterobacter hormaechei]MBT1721017.1 ead/Ea22-like family protein [Enterobacter hormaechei subsp. hoffmannii]MCM7810822.1 ead/Ea22-like family protein [Enterobacter hormaechei]MDA4763456.1 ead/Ea22-like family protein [Enterobacter hormaechei]RTP22455.1 ead/Ea22-like family protein [Enterobacter hormaechei]
MTDIQALREELSNPAIGSNAHLRKIALSLLDDLEKEKGYSSAYEAEKWHYHGLAESEGERADRAEKRIEEEICRANREHHRGFMMACNHLKEHENVHYADAAEMEIAALRQRIAELEAKIETADKLQDSAFRHGLQYGFSYGQTNDQAGFEQCLAAYSQEEKGNG